VFKVRPVPSGSLLMSFKPLPATISETKPSRPISVEGGESDEHEDPRERVC